MVTAAAGTTPPLGSVTVPSRVLANWAQADVLARLSVMSTTPTPRTTLLPIDMRSSGLYQDRTNESRATFWHIKYIFVKRIRYRVWGHRPLRVVSKTFQRLQRRFTCWVISWLVGGFSSRPSVWRTSWIT